jgi:L-erythro-3,5-diaminohexanoate dehydrogenase
MSSRATEPHPTLAGDPTGLHRVLDDRVVLPQAAQRLDTRRELWPDEVLEIVAERGKMQNPVTGSGGMLVGTVEEVGPESTLGLAVGDRVATLVSLSLTPLVIEDGLARWDGRSEQVPADGYAILFGRSIAATIPDDLPPALSLAVMDVCGAPALTHRVVAGYEQPVVAVIGGAGKSGSLSLAAAARAGCSRTVGVVPHEAEAALLRDSGLADDVVVADARDPIALRDAVAATGSPADVTVVCVDVPGCEGGAILATAEQGTVIFFSMATSFSAAALGAEGLAADVTMLVGNGYTPGHAAYAMDLLRADDGVRRLFERRL